jgi:uroporphyrinogen-III synthase
VGKEKANALRGKRVVVTRAEEQNQALAAALREKGAVPVLLSMVAFAPPDNADLVDVAIRGMNQYDWIFLTSQNALRALEERSEALDVALPSAAGASRVAAVGPATAKAAQSAGLKVEYVARNHRGTALAEELGEKVKGKSVLLPRSDRANPELVERLKALGANVKEVVAYKTVGPDDELSAKAKVALKGGADAVLFFSPSAVCHLQEVLGPEKFAALSQRALFTAVGPVTEQALRNAGVARIQMAGDTTTDSVLEALTDYFTAAGAKLPAGVKPQ